MLHSPEGCLLQERENAEGGLKAANTRVATDQGTSFYFIDVRVIAVGGKQLSISPVVFKSSGTIIDSGTVITRLPPAAYSALRAPIRLPVGNEQVPAGAGVVHTGHVLRSQQIRDGERTQDKRHNGVGL
nr:aspartyl protease family protein At5g10770-like [Ipomoea trifida]